MNLSSINELFYNPSLLINTQRFELTDQEFQHAIKVKRHKDGDILYTTNGKGLLVKGKIDLITKREAIIQVLDAKSYQNEEQVYLLIGTLKNRDRMEWLIEKATEIGVKAIHFINMDHSEGKKINTSRVEKIMISAIKQSKRLFTPDIKLFNDLTSAIDSHSNSDLIVFYEKNLVKRDKLPIPNKKALLIGPEGGFSKDEVQFLKEREYVKFKYLGDERLRAETAAIVALSLERWT